MYEGDKLCNNCFQDRKNSASSVEYQNIMNKNWGLYLIPFFGLGLSIFRAKKVLADECYDVFHVYINGNHEVWHDNKAGIYDKQKCKKCNDFFTYFYELIDIK